ncbi:MAG: DUF4405 domain-containing protein [Sedimentisphaerales bacterium]|nr:DUF4405 domain-containing protein [Sedimentisphaerales bacterium]
MKRNTWNFVLDGAAFLLLGALAWTGCLIHYILPPRHGRFRGTELLLFGWDRHDYGRLHFYLALGMLSLIAVHVWLHWSWVCQTVSGFLGRAKAKPLRRAVYGLTLLLLSAAGIAASLAWANSRVQETVLEGDNQAVEGHEEEFLPQMGQMSLQEISQRTGVPVERFIEQLHLPADVDVRERLGRLRRLYGFEMQHVRDVINRRQDPPDPSDER